MTRKSEAHTEIEVKFDVGMDTPVPDLAGAPSVTAASAPELTHPVSTYFDTADLALARARITLRRRTGSADAGWHVKLPVSSDERVEVRSPLSAGGNSTRVPDEVALVVRAHTRGRPLVPVASIETRRVITTVSTAKADRAAELCDDTVTARNLLDDITVRWREWELELVDGPRSTLRDLGTFLLDHGAKPGSSPSKLARALGSRLDAARETTSPQPDGTAGSALRVALAADVSALVAADPRVRRNEDDSVHAMRVATRRLRSVLRSYRALLDRAEVDAVRSELSWLAGILGTARDAEVLAERYCDALAALPADAVRGDVADSLIGTQERLYSLAHAEVVRELDGERYFALLDALEALLASSATGRKAGKPAARVFDRVLRAQYARVDEAHRRALALRDRGAEDEHEDAMHDVRKLAKKLRYAAEAAGVVDSPKRFARTAARTAKSAKKVQSVLGDHQDSAVARRTLLVEADSAHARGADTFTHGVLYAAEVRAGAEALEPFPSAWKTLRRTADRAGWTAD
ncbi:CYTH and CHAD domain-containing protein [Rhodococcoides corynebacterioides]|uniref:CYTH and CHAD domain-containing protein n=1 Tax=Rhodococcoides corynebacterioides TaxID=53972 RepID=UPI001C9A49CE|nr:CYTH and CHAD domain-containing protein [Rhodococcus corynebacterioides]MBY6351761.1 CYTH and CHAD domain-containing protein [Rhodococcus corynebacterioides]